MPAEQVDELREAVEALIDRAEARQDVERRLVTTAALRAALAATKDQRQRSEAVKAEALREAASDIVADCSNQPGPCICAARGWLRDRADVLSPPEARR